MAQKMWTAGSAKVTVKSAAVERATFILIAVKLLAVESYKLSLSAVKINQGLLKTELSFLHLSNLGLLKIWHLSVFMQRYQFQGCVQVQQIVLRAVKIGFFKSTTFVLYT